MDNVLQRTICRTCLTETSSYKSLLSKTDGDVRTLREILSNFINVDIIMSDKYPKHVCNECYTMLFKADEFKTRCLQSETILKNGFLSHTLGDLIKREMVTAELLKGSNSINNPQVSSNYFDNCVKKDTVATFEIEVAAVDNHYTRDIQRNNTNYVKEEEDDFLHDVNNDLSDNMVIESTSIDENLIATGIASDVANLKTIKDCSQIKEKKESSDGINELTLSCMLCHEEFSTYELLQIHSLTHRDIKNYPCSICNGNFTCKYSLKTHIKTHKVKAKVKQKRTKSDIENKSGIYLTLICPKCGQKFVGMKSFQAHLRSHKEDSELDNIKLLNNGVENYQCSLCMRKFVQRSSLVKHIKRHGDR